MKVMLHFLIFLNLVKSNSKSLPTKIGRKPSSSVNGLGTPSLSWAWGPRKQEQDLVLGFGGCCCFELCRGPCKTLQRPLQKDGSSIGPWKRWKLYGGSSPLWQAQLPETLTKAEQLVHRAHRLLPLLHLAISDKCLPEGSLPLSLYPYSIPRRCNSIGVKSFPSWPSKHKPLFLWLFQTIHLNYLEKHRPGIVISVDQTFVDQSK